MQLGDADEDRSNVEDRRRIPPAVKLGAGGTIAVIAIVLVVSLLTKSEPSPSGLSGQRGAPSSPARPQSAARLAAEKELERIAVGSFNDAQRVWADVLSRAHKKYRNAKLVLFWDQT